MYIGVLTSSHNIFPFASRESSSASNLTSIKIIHAFSSLHFGRGGIRVLNGGDKRTSVFIDHLFNLSTSEGS
jgi:hypothetical protein